MGIVWCGPVLATNVGAVHNQESVGQNGVGCSKGDATGDRRQLATESPYKEELELLRHSTDLRFDGSQMRRAYTAGKSCDWESSWQMADSAHGQA